jgi:phiEco32-like amidoligase-type 2 protein
MQKIQLRSVGADPEVFLVNKNGHPVSAEGLIGGTKDKPVPMEGLEPGYMVQEDNVAAEYNIPPCLSADDFSAAIFKGLRYVQRLAHKHDLSVRCLPALHFDPDQLATPHARRLGCDPDIDFWSLRYNEAPRPPETLRTAAGHVHVGWVNPDDEQRVALIRTLDLFLGVPSILVTEKNERRELYGKAGACRVKPYGVEYRTLDNFWLIKAPWRKHVFNQVQQACLRLNGEGEFFLEELYELGDDVRNCINNHDQYLARFLVNEFRIAEFEG